jgi:hypothetical protein
MVGIYIFGIFLGLILGIFLEYTFGILKKIFG